MPRDTIEALKGLESTITAILISGMGGIAHYFYQIQKGENFKIGMFCINVLLAGWLGYVISGVVSSESAMF